MNALTNNTLSQKYAPLMFVPSLERHGEFITIANISTAEAIEIAEAFNARVLGKRKTAVADASITDALDILEGSLDLEPLVEDGSIVELVEDLSLSKLKGQRGYRILYLDVERDVVGVGTTVIYNANRAMQGVIDGTVVGTLFDAVVDQAA